MQSSSAGAKERMITFGSGEKEALLANLDAKGGVESFTFDMLSSV